MCLKVSAAVRELEQEYKGQAIFEIKTPQETAASYDKILAFGFADLRHGLVIFDANGAPTLKLPGHAYGRAQIEAGLKAALGK